MPISLILSLLLFFLPFSSQANDRQITTSSQTEIPVAVFKPSKPADKILLWLPSEYGLHGRENTTATELAEKGIEVWIADLHTAYFTPPGRRSYQALNINDIAELIISASDNKQKQVILFATGRAAPAALIANRQLQLNNTTKDIVKSAVLLHPNFYTSTTEVGKEIDYLPVTHATNLAIYILQPALSGKAYQLKTLQKLLQKGGSDVIAQILPGVGDGYNLREPDNEKEALLYTKTASIIYNATELLAHFEKPRSAPALASQTPANKTQSLNIGLQPYQGNIKKLYLDFKDRAERHHSLEKHKGKVMLINFWASWCPPCVKELPSLDRLQNKVSTDNFSVLAINIGEDKQTVKDFLKPMQLSFPVLFDPEGKSVHHWNLVAFPSSFVIDRQGKIRYGLFGGIEWDKQEIVDIIELLISEQ